MIDAGHEPVTVEPPRRHRWLRREVWFVVVSVAVILLVFLAARHMPAHHNAPGVPYGTVPSPAPVVAAPRPAMPTS